MDNLLKRDFLYLSHELSSFPAIFQTSLVIFMNMNMNKTDSAPVDIKVNVRPIFHSIATHPITSDTMLVFWNVHLIPLTDSATTSGDLQDLLYSASRSSALGTGGLRVPIASWVTCTSGSYIQVLEQHIPPSNVFFRLVPPYFTKTSEPQSTESQQPGFIVNERRY